jgi:two-component system chemotaxis sensor kinase CheA
MDELLTEFLAETAESLAALDGAMIRLEQSPADPDTLALAFRLTHTIKGTCGFLNLPRLYRISHAAEDLLGMLRDGQVVTQSVVTAVLAAVDRMKALIGSIGELGCEPPGDDGALLASLRRDAYAATPATGVEAAQPEASGEAEEDGSPSPAAQTLRVHIPVLESLMTLVSELVLTRNQLLQIARSGMDSRLSTPLQRLSHLISDLQEGIMRTRMQPIRHAWATFPRLVRDLSAELGKQIALVMQGEETELDRQVLEMIRAPLTHMVRNCAGHGIELPEVRTAAGKPARGTITLRSFQEGGTIVIKVSDDGAGLSTERIRECAIARQLAKPAELSRWTEQQLQRLIFLPGFTTSTTVTQISGRGVGMDVVQTNIEGLGGTVDVASISGQGTEFTIRIPLTLAIISALIVDAGGQRFALPQSCVAEIVRADAVDGYEAGRLAVETVNNTPVLRLRDKLLPLVSLAGLLNLPARDSAGQSLTVVVAQLGGLQAGLLVDEVFDTEEIVVKPASRLLRQIPLFSGNTILGDGSVIMILDPSGLAKAIGTAPGTPSKQPAASQPRAERTGDRAAMLLVRFAPGAGAVAVPLALVARIESLAREAVERSSGRLVTRYRSGLMPLIEAPDLQAEGPTIPVLVFSDRGRSVGLMVAEIVDVVEDRLSIELSSDRPGMLGTALIAGHVTGVLDTGFWLRQAASDWFAGAAPVQTAAPPRILVVEDSTFYRSLLVPVLSARGYHVTAVESATVALGLRDGPEAIMFDAIISDVEMPGLDGLQFARAVRQRGPWVRTPLLAHSAQCTAEDVERGLACGFDEYVSKSDREGLLDALRRRLARPERLAA